MGRKQTSISTYLDYYVDRYLRRCLNFTKGLHMTGYLGIYTAGGRVIQEVPSVGR